MLVPSVTATMPAVAQRSTSTAFGARRPNGLARFRKEYRPSLDAYPKDLARAAKLAVLGVSFGLLLTAVSTSRRANLIESGAPQRELRKSIALLFGGALTMIGFHNIRPEDYKGWKENHAPESFSTGVISDFPYWVRSMIEIVGSRDTAVGLPAFGVNVAFPGESVAWSSRESPLTSAYHMTGASDGDAFNPLSNNPLERVLRVLVK